MTINFKCSHSKDAHIQLDSVLLRFLKFENLTYMVKDEACKKTGGIADVVVLVVPDITQKFDGKIHLFSLLPVELSYSFQDFLGIVLAQVGV